MSIHIDRSLIVREIDAEVVILNTRSNEIHRLNTTASQIWRSLQDGKNPAEIARQMATDFDVRESAALADVNSMVRELKALVAVST